MAKFYKVDQVRLAAKGAWESVLANLGVDSSHLTGKHTSCPGCGGKDRFRFDDKDGTGSWICSGGGDLQSGDGLKLVEHIFNLDWKEATNKLGESMGLNAVEYSGKSHAVSNGVAAKPQAQAKKKVNELYNEEKLRTLVAGVEDVTPEWFMERSPVDPRGVMPGEFLDAVFQAGERVLVFSNFFSQGDFAWEVGRGGFRLGEHEGVQAVKSRLPLDGGKKGVWFLSNPVNLGWEPNPRKQGEKSRRTKECVTNWRYLVLESDDAPEGLWLKFLAIFPDRIKAIYSSGGRSWHALLQVDMESWADMDGLLKGNPRAKSASSRSGAKAVWAEYGADPGALTPVRLTRLPGCTRNGAVQKLIYLNPHPKGCFENASGGLVRRRIVDLVPRRKL